ncbi:hypothetical protein [Spirosoma pollinicola]|uniref:hypothetical protein n=1 Tax=Spirosoma pollinicola TaxID=2057025 RepID=UPI0012FD7D35|nr:hypothetical protein [Spirosoma pollinicola]
MVSLGLVDPDRGASLSLVLDPDLVEVGGGLGGNLGGQVVGTLGQDGQGGGCVGVTHEHEGFGGGGEVSLQADGLTGQGGGGGVKERQLCPHGLNT